MTKKTDRFLNKQETEDFILEAEVEDGIQENLRLGNLKIVGVDKNGNNLYSLTEKGKLEAKKLLGIK